MHLRNIQIWQHGSFTNASTLYRAQTLHKQACAIARPHWVGNVVGDGARELATGVACSVDERQPQAAVHHAHYATRRCFAAQLATGAAGMLLGQTHSAWAEDQVPGNMAIGALEVGASCNVHNMLAHVLQLSTSDIPAV